MNNGVVPLHSSAEYSDVIVFKTIGSHVEMSDVAVDFKQKRQLHNCVSFEVHVPEVNLA